MQRPQYKFLLTLVVCLSLPTFLNAFQEHQAAGIQQGPVGGPGAKQYPNYVLGSDDEITIRALDAEEISNKPIRIDGTGNINVPMLGTLHASGLTVRQLEADISTKLAKYVLNPEVSVAIVVFRSQPVSVIGSVNRPGTLQLEGHKTLIEVLSLAGGLSSDAGNILKLTRQAQWGKIPLPDSTMDPSGKFSIAEISLRSLMEARKPEENITIMPEDVLSVPRGQMVYVMGEVNKPGGFVLAEREATSILQVLAMAQGLTPTAAAKSARIIRPVVGSNRLEIPVNVKDILAGKKVDIPLKAEDILVVPSSYARSAWRRTLDQAISTATGVVIYRGW
jgi:polysaccharide export outer membrane protein